MFQACTGMIGAPWLCWAIQGMALLLIALFIWRIVKRRGGGPGMPIREMAPGDARLVPVPVRPNSRGRSSA